MNTLLSVVCAALVLSVAGAATAAAGTGGAAPVDLSEQTTSTSSSGGSAYDDPAAKKHAAEAKRAAELRATPVLTGIKLSGTTLVDNGAPLKLHYRIKAPARHVRVRLLVRTAGGKYIKTLQLGLHRTKVLQTTALTQTELGITSAGSYRIRLVAKDGKGRAALRAAKVPVWLSFTFSDHRFPVAGKFSYGGDDARFGAGRPGHIHQGQDVVADAGEPIVAPYGGAISYVDYQAGGAGYYVVEHSLDGRDYVFMHLLKGSTTVKLGDAVKTGQLLGKVGATGDASGPHLHFEVWEGGPWQFGGHPVDPLPLLKAWYAAGPGGAVQTSSTRTALGPDYPLD